MPYAANAKGGANYRLSKCHVLPFKCQFYIEMLQVEPPSTNGRSFAGLASECTLRCGAADIMTALSPAMLLVLAVVIIANFTFQITNSQTPLFSRQSGHVVTLLRAACHVFNAPWRMLSMLSNVVKEAQGHSH